MAGRYELVRDFAVNDGVPVVNPAWVLAVIRLKELVSFDRQTKKARSLADSAAIEERDPIVIDSDCISLVVNTTKESHISALTATLLPGQYDYVDVLMPGDWLMAWIVNSDGEAADLVQRIKAKETVNYFNDGLKFVGRITSVRKQTSVDRKIGNRFASYTVQAGGNLEFDSQLFYEPQLTRSEFELSWMQRFGLFIKDIANGNDSSANRDAGAIDINKIIPKLLKVLMGEGPFRKDNTQAIGPPDDPDAYKETPNSAYLVPMTVGKLLSRDVSSKGSGILTYADLLDLIIGVQSYGESQNLSNTERLFCPDGLQDNTDAFKSTGKPLMGEFPIVIPPFNMTPIWQMLSHYLNPAVNEMFVTLRVNNAGLVVPQLIVRQLPFSSTAREKIDSNNQGAVFFGPGDSGAITFPTTKFLELPRWVVDETLLYEADVGRSDALRFNFVHVTGQVGAGTVIDEVGQYIRAPPVVDELDVKRSGLRPFMKTVNCLLRDGQTGPKQWIDLLTDIAMGQHLTLTGTFIMQGIQAPICPGDNLEFNGTVYHIETVTHQCTIDMNGQRQFQTSCQVDHGMNGEAKIQALGRAGIGRDLQDRQYAGIQPDDGVTIVPTTTAEGA